MKSLFFFMLRLAKKSKEDGVIESANALTYKLLLAIFPFLIFLMSLLGYFNIDSTFILEQASQSLPKEAMSIINVFVSEVIDTKNLSLLSTSLLITIISASSGFDAIIRNINKAFKVSDTRNILLVRLISIGMVFVFSSVIIFSTSLFIFSDTIESALLKTNIPIFVIEYVFSFSTYIVSFIILILITAFIYKISVSKRISLVNTFPGAITTVLLWVVSSFFFNLYISNFSKYSKVYGSIGSVFILMLWLNLISFFLLIGSEINSMIALKK